MNLQIWLSDKDKKITDEIKRLARDGHTRSEIAKMLIERGMSSDVEKKIDEILQIVKAGVKK